MHEVISFLGENKKNIISLLSAESSYNVVSVKSWYYVGFESAMSGMHTWYYHEVWVLKVKNSAFSQSHSLLSQHVPSKDSGQPVHSCSLIRTFTRLILDSYWYKGSVGKQGRINLACAFTQADLSCRSVHLSECMFSLLRFISFQCF